MKNLEEEILNQLRLINYNRSKTLLEQDKKKDLPVVDIQGWKNPKTRKLYEDWKDLVKKYNNLIDLNSTGNKYTYSFADPAKNADNIKSPKDMKNFVDGVQKEINKLEKTIKKGKNYIKDASKYVSTTGLLPLDVVKEFGTQKGYQTMHSIYNHEGSYNTWKEWNYNDGTYFDPNAYQIPKDELTKLRYQPGKINPDGMNAQDPNAPERCHPAHTKVGKIYDKIVKEVEGGWFFGVAGTDVGGLVEAVLSIKTQKEYNDLRLCLLIKYPETLQMSITEFLQSKEFSNALQTNGRNYPLDIQTQQISFFFNDQPLYVIQEHLKQFNSNEKVTALENPTAMDRALPPLSSDLLHMATAATSLAIGIFLPASWPWLIASGLIELADAYIYLEQKNYYAAGLAAFFAFVPFGMMKFAPAVYKVGKPGILTLLKKVSTPGSKFIDEEFELLQQLLKNEDEFISLTTEYMVSKTTLYLLSTIKTAKVFLKFLFKLIDKLILKPESLGQIGLWIGGAFVTWDVIAAKLGICNTIPLANLSQSDWKILKAVGWAGKYLQPSSSPCDIQKAKEILDQHNNLNVIKNILQDEADAGTVFDTRYVGTYNLGIDFIQTALLNGGFYNKLPQVIGKYQGSQIVLSNADIVNKIEIYDVNNNLKKTQNNYSSNLTIDLKGLSKGIYFLIITPKNGAPTKEKIVFDGTKINQYETFISTYGKHKEGFYDEQTVLAVLNYQKINKLSTKDGLCGPETIKSIISDYENHRYGLTKDFVNKNFDLDEQKVEKINKEFQKWKESVENQNITEEQVEEAYKIDEENKNKANKVVTRAMQTAANDMDPKDAKNLIDFAHDGVKNQ